MADVLPFEQHPDESARAYAAFIEYRDMGPQRSVRDVAQKLNKSVTVIGRWSTQHNWVERARSYDAALDARARQATEQQAIEQRRQMLDRHAQQARDLQEISTIIKTEFHRRYDEKGTLKWVDGTDFLKLMALLPKMIETGQKHERLAMGEATERHEHTLTIDQVAGMGLEELEAYMRENNIPL